MHQTYFGHCSVFSGESKLLIPPRFPHLCCHTESWLFSGSSSIVEEPNLHTEGGSYRLSPFHQLNSPMALKTYSLRFATPWNSENGNLCLINTELLLFDPPVRPLPPKGSPEMLCCLEKRWLRVSTNKINLSPVKTINAEDLEFLCRHSLPELRNSGFMFSKRMSLINQFG